MTSLERTYKKEERPLDCGVMEAKGDRCSKDGVERPCVCPRAFWRAGGGRRKFSGSAQEIAEKCAYVAVWFVKGRRDDQENEMSMMLEGLAEDRKDVLRMNLLNKIRRENSEEKGGLRNSKGGDNCVARPLNLGSMDSSPRLGCIPSRPCLLLKIEFLLPYPFKYL